MRLTFRGVAIGSALVFGALALTMVFAPQLIVADWGLEVSRAVAVVCRRAGVLFLGLAFMLASARNAEPSAARSAMVQGIAVVCALLAALGMFEFVAGNVTSAILIPIGIELVLLLAFALVGWRPPASRRF